MCKIHKGARDFECLKQSKDLYFYRLYCSGDPEHDKIRLHELTRAQHPILMLLVHPIALNDDLIRVLSSFLI